MSNDLELQFQSKDGETETITVGSPLNAWNAWQNARARWTLDCVRLRLNGSHIWEHVVRNGEVNEDPWLLLTAVMGRKI